jgi:small subunit ribosomal protein S6
MEKKTHLYETTFIVNASLDDTQVENVIGRVQDVITNNGGTISMLNKWGRKRLAYPINKKTNGFYVNMEFDAPGSLVAPLERAFQLDEMVLRHLVIRLSANALKAKAAAEKAASTQEQEAPKPVPAREPLFKEGSEKKSES